ncbi:MAG: hypothetical protein AD742_05825 [Methylibium sp. NZG]|nr:MAG: hypothetical protein AD742_05825 [Methylibium sp. NZG]
MQITDILSQLGGLQSMARELGVSESQAASGAEALIPAILGGFKKQAQAQPTGLDGLGGLLSQLGGGGLLDQVLAPQPTNVSQGNDVLGQIFGSKDVSRTVAQNASAQTGLSPDLLKKMLPLLAMLVAGFMAKQGSAGGQGAAGAEQATDSPFGGGGLGSVLGAALGGGGAGGGTAGGGGLGGGLGGLLGGLLGGGAGRAAPGAGMGGGMGAGAGTAQGGLASMLDLNGDGNPLDDILRMAGKAMR